MEIRFTATEFACTEDHGALVCGASNSKTDEPFHYVTMSRSADPADPEDDGIHFEIDDQINGGYHLLASCAVSPRQFTIELLRDVPRHPGIRRIVVGCDEAP